MKSQPAVKRISIDDAKRRRKELLFVDARSATALARNPMEIAGAIHLPMKEMDQNLATLPHGKTVVTYCT